ncbi:hypothetical protein BKA70DRAFT_43727 [Coprinopsis sp. MPI-PUGE-AT-0042]|nr:hypothetical protein BKA70DRAFT_43727 [Coprinopsis sp. MPI-PUGE-AT-0042]
MRPSGPPLISSFRISTSSSSFRAPSEFTWSLYFSIFLSTARQFVHFSPKLFLFIHIGDSFILRPFLLLQHPTIFRLSPFAFFIRSAVPHPPVAQIAIPMFSWLNRSLHFRLLRPDLFILDRRLLQMVVLDSRSRQEGTLPSRDDPNPTESPQGFLPASFLASDVNSTVCSLMWFFQRLLQAPQDPPVSHESGGSRVIFGMHLPPWPSLSNYSFNHSRATRTSHQGQSGSIRVNRHLISHPEMVDGSSQFGRSPKSNPVKF